MKTNTKSTENQAENGNKSKPLLVAYHVKLKYYEKNNINKWIYKCNS